MASITITTTAKQDAFIAWALTRENTRRELHGLPPLTFSGYVLGELIASWGAQMAEEESNVMIEKYRQATAAEQAAIKATLKI